MPKRIYFLILLTLVISVVSPVSAQSSDGPIYIVQSGDTLSSIASRFNISVADLMDANGISDPNLLAVGQELVIPGLQGVSGVLLTEYVQYGDSFRSLSRRTQVDKAMLRRLNRLVSPSELYVGTSLIVPQQESAGSLNARITPASGESLLELAVKQNTSPWALTQINQLEGTWQALPGDVLYASGDGSEVSATGLPAVFEKASIGPLPIKQGGTAVVRVQVPDGVTVSGKLVDHELRFFPDTDGSQVALQGVHAMLDPGPYPLLLEAALPDGSMQSFEQMVLVISGGYPREDLYVESSTIDSAVTKPEEDQLYAITADATPTKYWNGIFSNPSAYPDCFTSRYGTRRTYYGVDSNIEIQGFHSGLDFCGGEGLQITAPAAGKVVFAGPWIVRGNATIIDHGWGVYSGFWHQSEIDVQVGQTVEQGQVIGLVGGTGRVTGAHQHWEVWANGVQVDPLDWLYNIYP